jgi:hypothetical protein
VENDLPAVVTCAWTPLVGDQSSFHLLPSAQRADRLVRSETTRPASSTSSNVVP